MNRLQEKYKKEILAELKKELNVKSDLAVPKLDKIVLNVGLGKSISDSQFEKVAINTLERITGQKPLVTKAKKSISNFKIRQGMKIGAKVTLRGTRMYDFLDKMINVAMPRVRDFRGLDKKSVDPQGNLNIGFQEYIVFPEIKSDEVEKLHGLEVAIVTVGTNREASIKLLEKIGLPFKKTEQVNK